MDLRRHGFLSEILSPPVLALFGRVVIRLHMERRALVSVGVARIAVIVNNVVLWMAQHIRPVLTLLQSICLCHYSLVRLFPALI